MSDAQQSRKQPRRATGETALPRDRLPLLGGRFDLLAELGSGSSGTVYRARLREDRGELVAGSEVAVKFLRQDRMDDGKALERLQQEGQLGQQVRHPNVAAIHGAETLEVLGLSVTYLVMELVQGTTLRAFLQGQGPPVEDLIRRIGADAAGGLHALHRHGVVHRDVKPENLVLTPDGRVKVVDLGLARPFGAIGGGSSPSGQAGSVSYTAPEVLQGRPAQPRSDLYSLGIVLYEVATGKHPFAQRTTADEMLHAHVFETPAPPSHSRPRLSPMLEQLLLELLHKEPEQRPKDGEAVARILTLGERSEWWRKHEEKAPALASERRLRRMRRFADVPYFGRKPEQQRLDALLAEARSGRGSAVVVSGPEGMGKRRLYDECMARWLQTWGELLYLGGETDPGRAQGEPFAATLLDHLLRGDSRDSPSARQRLQHRARTELLLSEPDAASLAATVLGQSQEPSEARAALLSRALLLLARPGRTVVVRVDRAERLDTTGRLVLQRLQAEAPRHAMLLLLAATQDAAMSGAYERIELSGLEEADFLAFGQALFRGDMPEELLHAAHVALSGSPGNLIEALENMVQSGELRGSLGDYHGLQPGASLRPAPGHLQRFENRVATLPQAHRRVLEAAAVLGDRFPVPDLAALVAVPELQVLETLSLFRGRVLRALGGEVHFRHRDFRQALLHGIDDAARGELHRRAAAILEARAAPPLEVGMHLSRALEHEACLEPLLQALAALAARGSRRTSLRVAARLRVHFQHVAPGRTTDERRLRWLLLHAESRRNAQQPGIAVELLRQARELAQQLALTQQEGEALFGLGAAASDQGLLHDAVTWLEQAHACLDPGTAGESPAAAARAHGLHARVLLYLGQSTEGMRHMQFALRVLPAEQGELHSDLLIDLARLEALRHHYPTALKTLRKVEGELEDRHLPRLRMRLLLYRGQFRAVIEDDAATHDLRGAAEDAVRLSLPGYAGRAHVFLAERAFRRQKDDEARAEALRAVEYARAASDRLGGILAAILLYRLGDQDRELGSMAELSLPSLRAAWLLAMGARAQETGDEAAVQQHAEAALAVLASSDLPLPLQVRILHLAGREATARTLVRGIAERFPSRDTRRRFLAVWERNVRI